MELLRLLRAPSTLLSTIIIILTYTNPARSLPYGPEDPEITQAPNATLDRRCANPCGWVGLCCGANQYCFTDSNDQAQCGNGAGGGGTTAAAGGSGGSGGYWQYYTSTWVETDTITMTSVYSSYVAGAAATTSAAVASATPSCNWSLNEAPCGPICCASGQYCLVSGQCAAAGGGSSGYYSNTASAPLRPTSLGTGIATATISPTTTVPFETPVATGANVTLTQSSTSGGGLSGGAIAGIVIGVILAVILLALLCFYFCLDFLLGLFGIGGRRRRRREEEVYVEEHRHRSHSGRGDRTWYGANRPARVVREERVERRESSGRGGALGLGTMAAALGFNRARRDDRRRRRQDEKTEYSSSTASYSYDYTTSASE
ncbi:hypothetical protein EV356DRAFT_534027 [Viridothelium virens]|uniref:Uncharacterized protein n=1 Tax=Viridothelium virens TaxID=1048519 RepID=A0A6A6H615_VIRVR|nr:hypothetical protein EV356DRAFT_534027 [Viridothelium virens]